MHRFILNHCAECFNMMVSLRWVIYIYKSDVKKSYMLSLVLQTPSASLEWMPLSD